MFTKQPLEWRRGNGEFQMTMTSLSRLHARLRANFRRQNQAAQTTDETSWRRDFQRMNEIEEREVARLGASRTYTMGGVVIFGWQQFDSIVASRNAPKKARALQGDYLFHHRATGLQPDGDTDLVIAWRDAICFEMGLEEYHEFLLARRKRGAHDGNLSK